MATDQTALVQNTQDIAGQLLSKTGVIQSKIEALADSFTTKISDAVLKYEVYTSDPEIAIETFKAIQKANIDILTLRVRLVSEMAKLAVSMDRIDRAHDDGENPFESEPAPEEVKTPKAKPAPQTNSVFN